MGGHVRYLSALLIAASGCVYHSQPSSGGVTDANFTLSLTNVRVGQPTQATVQLSYKGVPAPGVEITLGAAQTVSDAATVVATGQSDANGLFTTSYTPNANGNVVLNANVVVDSANLLLTPVVLHVVAGATPGFAIVKNYTTRPTVGDSVGFTLYALTAANANNLDVEPSYTGVVAFSSPDDLQATLPGNVTFTGQDKGIKQVTGLVMTHATSMTLVATDEHRVTGRQVLAVNPGVATTLQVTYAPAAPQAGQPITVSVVPTDTYGNLTTYGGTVVVVATPSQTGTQATSVNASCATGETTLCSATLALPGTGGYTITATAPSDGGASVISSGGGGAVTVVPGAVTAFGFSGLRAATAGVVQTFTVSALDDTNTVVPSFTGTVHFTSTDAAAAASVPADYTYRSADAGVHTFTTGLVFVTAGQQSVAASNAGVSSQSNSVNIIAGSPNQLALALVSGSASGSAPLNANVRITARDSYNNTVISFADVVLAGVTDPKGAVTPANFTFSQGVATFVAKFVTANTAVSPWAATVTDTSNAALNNSLLGFMVSAGQPTQVAIAAASNPASLCVANGVSVMVEDAYGNITANNNNVSLNVTSGVDTFSYTKQAANGTASFSYTPPVSGIFTFTAYADGLSSSGNANATVAASTPVVSLSAAAEAGGCVALSYSVSGVCNANVTVQFKGAAGVYENATLGPGSSAGIYNVNLAQSKAQTFVWDSTRDQPNWNGLASVQLSVPGAAVKSVVVPLVNGANLQPVASSLAGSVAGVRRAQGDLNHNAITDVVQASGSTISYTLDGLAGQSIAANLSSPNDVVQSLVLASFSQDGNMQVVGCLHDTANNANNALFAYSLRNGSLTAVMSPILSNCSLVKAVDVNRDGLTDIVTADSLGNILWYINQGSYISTLNFGPAQSVSLGAATLPPNSINVTDFDRNGTLDLLVAPAANPNMFIVFGDGNNFVSPLALNLGVLPPTSLDVADFDRDGVQDIVLAQSGNSTAHIWWGNPAAAAFANPISSTGSIVVPISGTPLFALDVDGNGYADIVSTATATSISLAATLNTEPATYRAFASAPAVLAGSTLSAAPVSFASATLVRPGQTDLLVTSNLGTSGLLNSRAPRCNAELTAPRAFTTATNVFASAVSDVNADGKVDVVSVAASSAPTIAVSLGDGTGVLRAGVTFTVDSSFTYGRPALADLDGDGNVDIALPGYVTTTLIPYLIIFAGTGNGNFNTTPVLLTLGTSSATPVQALATKLRGAAQTLSDIVLVASTQSGNTTGALTALLNRSSPGQFAFSLTINALPQSPSMLVATPAATDLNKDGTPDFALLDASGVMYGVYGAANGVMTVGAGNGNHYVDLVTDDFTGDGRADVFAVNANASLSLYTGVSGVSPTYTFTGVAAAAPNCTALSLEKSLNANTLSLAVLCNGPAQRVVVMPVSGGTLYYRFNVPVSLPTASVGRAFFGDVSNDGAPDVIAASYTDGYLYVAQYDGDLAVPYQGADASDPTSVNANPNGLALVSYKRSGNLDAISLDPVSSTYQIWSGYSTAEWDLAPLATFGSFTWQDVAAADVNQDGNAEIAVATPLAVGITPKVGAGISLNGGGNRVALVDLNNDGWLDVVAVAYGAKFTYWMNARSTAAPFSSTPTGSISVANLSAFAFGDIDGSGANAALVGTTGGVLQAYRFIGGMAVQVGSATAVTGLSIRALALVDFNQDGVLDAVVVANAQSSSQAFVAVNDGSGTFEGPFADIEYGFPSVAGDIVATGDLNQDGVPDLAVPLSNTGLLQVLTGNPNGTFNGPASYMLGYRLGVPVIADIDLDNRPDISVTCANPSNAITRHIITSFAR